MDVPYGQADRIAKLVPEVLKITLDDCLADAKRELRAGLRQRRAGARGGRHGPAARGPDPPGLHPRRRRGHLRGAAHRLPAAHAEGRRRGGHPGLHGRRGEARACSRWTSWGCATWTSSTAPSRSSGREGTPTSIIETIPLDDADDLPDAGQGRLRRACSSSSPAACATLCARSSPPVFDDLIALVALYRPGPMEFIPQYARNKRDPEGVKYVDDRVWSPSSPHLRGGHLPRAAHGDLQADRRLHALPGRRPAQGHRQEDQGEDGPPGAQVPGGGRGRRHVAAGGRPPVVAHGEGRRLLLQQVATPPATRSSPTAPPISRPTTRCSTWRRSSPASWTPRTRCPST